MNISFQKESNEVDLEKQVKQKTGSVEVDLTGAKLGEAEKGQLCKVLNDIANIFSEKPGLTHVATHAMETGECRSGRARPYRYDTVK